MQKPESMDECLYFSNRSIGDGKAMAWVLRPECEKCKKGRIGKPIKKNGKPDKKASYFECPECKHHIPNEQAAEILKVSVEYTCPYCKHQGETQTEYKRKSFQGVQAFVFLCEKCSKKIPITKKLKELKDKG